MARRRKPTGSRSSTIRLRNLSAVLLMLLRHGYISRVRLAQLTGLSTTTITNLITDLIEQGIVIQEDDPYPQRRRRGVGRPQMALRLVPEARYALGVHIGVGSVRVAMVDLLANPLRTLELEHPLEHTASNVLDEIVQLSRAVITQSGIDPARLVGVGVGASGLVDRDEGINLFAPNLGWRDVPIREHLQAALGCEVVVDNNVRAMALGEALFGAGQDVEALAFVYARIGVGAGIVVGGQLYHGGGAGAGEIGHTTMLPDGGETCRCGNSGCLETLISEPVIVRLAREIAAQEPEGQLAAALQTAEGPELVRIFAAARAGDAAAQAMLDARARYMGIALANMVDVLNPELIVLGGIFAQGEDVLLPVIKETMRARAFAQLGDAVRLQPPSFGDDAGVIGAAALALNTCFYRRIESER